MAVAGGTGNVAANGQFRAPQRGPDEDANVVGQGVRGAAQAQAGRAVHVGRDRPGPRRRVRDGRADRQTVSPDYESHRAAAAGSDNRKRVNNVIDANLDAKRLLWGALDNGESDEHGAVVRNDDKVKVFAVDVRTDEVRSAARVRWSADGFSPRCI